MLEKLGFKKKQHVGISISTNNFIELVCVDKATKSVVKYASGNIKYNNAIKEIIDFDEFAEVVASLFDEAGFNPSDCAVTLNLPNVHFGITSFDSASESPYIIENLQSEIEDLYIFKRNEPIISYIMPENSMGHGQKNILYGAIQTKVVAKIIEIFDNLGVELVKIDSSYSSMLKAIQFCDRFNKTMQKEEMAYILLITSNSCCSFYLNGNIIKDFEEEPLAVKSFSPEEVYSVISKIAVNFISKNKPNSVLIISETDEVNSELIEQRINFQGDVDCINKSVNSSDQFIDVTGIGSDIDANMISYLTIEAVGAAVDSYDNYPLNINYMPPDRVDANVIQIKGYEINLYRFALILLISAIVAAVLFCSLVALLFGILSSNAEKKTGEAQNQIQIFKSSIEKNNSQKKKDILPILTKIVETNKSVVEIYNALSTDIPDSVYIKKYVTNAAGGIGILGEAKTSESVQEFVKRLREKNNNLMLSKLSINSKTEPVPSSLQNGYTFEIKTSNTDVILTDDTDTAESGIQNNNNNNSNYSRNRMMPPPSPII